MIKENAEREYVNLPKEDIERLRQKFLPDWEYKDNSLQKRYKFEDYFEVVEFLINTIKPQEKLDHHADLVLTNLTSLVATNDAESGSRDISTNYFC